MLVGVAYVFERHAISAQDDVVIVSRLNPESINDLIPHTSCGGVGPDMTVRESLHEAGDVHIVMGRHNFIFCTLIVVVLGAAERTFLGRDRSV